MISIIIPTLNEAAMLPRLLDGLRRQGAPCEIIVVDGGSDDGTIELAREAGVKILRSDPGRGLQLSKGADAATGDVKVDRMLGFSGSFGQEIMGLDMDVAQNVLRAVGNYGEIYERNLGPGGIDLPREGGRNALWSNAPCTDCPKGGQIYAAPLR